MIEREVALITGFCILITSLTTGTILTSWMIRLSWRIGAMDKPQGELKDHKQPTATLGGVALFLGVVCGLTLLPITGRGLTEGLIGWLHFEWRWAWIPVGCLLVLVMGIKDDLFHIIPRNKLIFQVIAALMILYSGIFHVKECVFFDVFSFSLGVLSVPFMFFWLVGSCNAFNFIDGADGLASGIGMVTSLLLAALAFMTNQFGAAMAALAMAGSLGGVLLFNFRPALIFLGDNGSQLVGLVLGMLTLEITTTDGRFALPAAGFLLAVPVMDTLLAILRRISHGQSPTHGDHGHIHHRLRARGHDAARISFILWTATLCCGMMGIMCWYMQGPAVGMIALVFAGLLFYLGVKMGCLEPRRLLRKLMGRSVQENVTTTGVLQRLTGMWERMKPLFEQLELEHVELVLEKSAFDGTAEFETFQWSRQEALVTGYQPQTWTRQIRLQSRNQNIATLRIKETHENQQDAVHINSLLSQIQCNFEKARNIKHACQNLKAV